MSTRTVRLVIFSIMLFIVAPFFVFGACMKSPQLLSQTEADELLQDACYQPVEGEGLIYGTVIVLPEEERGWEIEVPAGDVYVLVREHSSDEPGALVASAKTDSDGEFSLCVAEGTYRMSSFTLDYPDLEYTPCHDTTCHASDCGGCYLADQANDDVAVVEAGEELEWNLELATVCSGA